MLNFLSNKMLYPSLFMLYGLRMLDATLMMSLLPKLVPLLSRWTMPTTRTVPGVMAATLGMMVKLVSWEVILQSLPVLLLQSFPCGIWSVYAAAAMVVPMVVDASIVSKNLVSVLRPNRALSLRRANPPIVVATVVARSGVLRRIGRRRVVRFFLLADFRRRNTIFLFECWFMHYSSAVFFKFYNFFNSSIYLPHIL